LHPTASGAEAFIGMTKGYARHGLLDALTDPFFRAQSARLAKALRARGIRVETVF